MKIHKLEIICSIEPIRQIAKALGKDSDLHLVGGCIRDMFLKKIPKDFDFATVLAPEVVERRCAAAGIKTVIVGIRRGTISAIIDGEAYEITTFRQKGKETLFSKTIEEDLAARDFTINAIAYNLRTNEIVDPYNGLGDIQYRILRTVGSAKERFTEDPHRILRMCRFAAQFDCAVSDEQVQCAIDLQDLLATIEPERINAELKKIFVTLPRAALLRCLMYLDDVGFYKIWIPELAACKGVTQNRDHEYDVYKHTFSVVFNCENYRVKMAALFHDIGKVQTKTIDENGDVHFYGHEDKSAEMAEVIMQRLKFSRADMDSIIKLIKFHMRPIECGKKAIRKLKAALENDFENWLQLKHADKFFGGTPDVELEKYKKSWATFMDLLHEVEQEETVHPTAKLAINGEVVMKLLDLKPGPEVGVWLDKCKEYVYEYPEKNTIEHLTGFLIATECREEQVAS